MTGTCHIAVAMKPLTGGFTQNALKHGVAGLNLDGCRVQTTGRPLRVIDAKETNNTAYAGRMNGSLAGGSKAIGTTSQGRFPANLVLGHSLTCHRRGMKQVKGGIAFEPKEGEQIKRNIFGAAGTLGRKCGYADPDGKEEIEDWDCAPECPIRLLGEQSGEAMGFSGGGIRKVKSDIMPSIQVGKDDAKPNYYADSGTAARYFKQVSEFKE